MFNYMEYDVRYVEVAKNNSIQPIGRLPSQTFFYWHKAHTYEGMLLVQVSNNYKLETTHCWTPSSPQDEQCLCEGTLFRIRQNIAQDQGLILLIQLLQKRLEGRRNSTIIIAG